MVTTLEVGTNTYVTRTDANAFHDDDVNGASWQFVGDDAKDRALLTATRLIEQRRFLGDKTSSGQALSFPRTGLTDLDGNAVASDSVPQRVKDAQALLARLLAATPTLSEKKGTSSNQKRVKAGSVEVEYFRPETGQRFPPSVMELLGPFLASGRTAAVATGLVTPEDYDAYEVGEPYA